MQPVFQYRHISWLTELMNKQTKENLFLAYLSNPIEEHFFPDDLREDVVDI